jgi:quercetin dioxygenase-like cupin family protein
VTGRSTEKPQNYSVKRVEPVLKGSDVQARIFTLAPGERVPWHYHRQSRDHYFVFEGILSVTTRNFGEKTQTIGVGGAHSVAPGTAHLIANEGSVDCRFLLPQGVGTYDWIKVD